MGLLDVFIAFLLGVLIGWLASRPGLARAKSALAAERTVHIERLKSYQEADARLREAFQALSAEALRSNNRAFLDLAESRLREARTEATGDMEARKKAIEDLLSPLARTLEHVDREIKDSERRRLEGRAQLLERLGALDQAGRDLQAETRRLIDALKRPGVRGRWGEIQLKRVVELAGMIEHCDFFEQRTFSGQVPDDDDEKTRRMRPDVVIRLPGGKHIVIDAKAPLEAYLRALEAPDESVRLQLLEDHARQVRSHMTQLAAKGYAANIDPSPDFVIMFLPGEMFFSAALEHDPTLIEYGVDLHVVPASPTTLIALLRAVAYGWQQDAMEQNARTISEYGKSLYESVRRLAEHFDHLGGRLKASLDAYNQAVGSLEGNVLIKARKLKELQAASHAEEIPNLSTIDRVPRMLQSSELTDGLPFSDKAGESDEAMEPTERV